MMSAASGGGTAASMTGMGISGIFFFIGFAMAVVLFVFSVLPGTRGPNNYGPDPYGADVEQAFA